MRPRRGTPADEDIRRKSANYQIIGGSRRRRIAQGSGTTVEDVNRLLKNFAATQKMFKQMGKAAKKGKMPFPGMFG